MPSSTTDTLVEQGAAQLLGLQHHRLLRARHALLPPAGQVSEFKTMVKSAALGRHRGDPRRRLQPHRRGQRARPDAVVPRHRQRRLLPAASPDNPRYYMDFTGTGNTLNMQHPRVLQLIMDSLRYWVQEMHVDGFRFDLASALARELFEVDRLAVVLRQRSTRTRCCRRSSSSPSPGMSARAATRSATFRRAGTSGTTSTATRVRAYWKGDGGLIAEFAPPLHRLRRPLRAQRPQAPREHQLRHRPRRLHAAGSRQLQREAQRGQRRGQPRRHATTTLAGTAASEGPTDDPQIRALRAAPEAQLDRDAAALAGRADAARGR